MVIEGNNKQIGDDDATLGLPQSCKADMRLSG
jgi:hypothetical protein